MKFEDRFATHVERRAAELRQDFPGWHISYDMNSGRWHAIQGYIRLTAATSAGLHRHLRDEIHGHRQGDPGL